MAKFKLTAGAEFDTLTKTELLEALQVKPSWVSETEHGIRFSRFTAQQIPASNAVDFGGAASQGELLGPQPGFIWDIRRLRLIGLHTADSVAIYQNDPNPSSQIDVSSSSNRTLYWSEQVILYPGDALRIVATGLNATTTLVTITGMVREVPVTLAWRLGN